MTDDRSESDGDRDHEETDPANGGADTEEDVPAVAAMGGTETADALAQQDDYEERIDPSAGGVGRPTPALPIDQLEAIEPLDRRELARDHGQAWPSTEEARERLSRTMRQEDERVVDAPTSLGKSYSVAATPWGSAQYAAITSRRPVVHLSKTRDARDEAVATSEEATPLVDQLPRDIREQPGGHRGRRGASRRGEVVHDAVVERAQPPG